MVASYPILGGGVPAAVATGLPLPERSDEPPVRSDGPLTEDFLKRLHDQIAMAEKEWDTRFLRYFRQRGEVGGIDVGRLLGLRPAPVPTSFTEGVVGLLESGDPAASPGELAAAIRAGALEAE